MRRLDVILVSVVVIMLPAIALAGFNAQYNFENKVPQSFSSSQEGTLTLSPDHYKDGENSMLWSWSAPSVLTVADFPALSASAKNIDNGLMLWIYNPQAIKSTLRFEIEGLGGKVEYSFNYGLDYTGWRACWVRYRDMKGEFDKSKELARIKIYSPEGVSSGKLYFDRMTISAKAINRQVTPDKQFVHNHSNIGRDLWHWALLWEWWQKPHNIPLDTPTAEQKASLERAARQLTDVVSMTIPNENLINQRLLPDALAKLKNSRITRTADGGVIGGALVSDDEAMPDAGDVKYVDFQNMLYAFALDKAINKSDKNMDNFFLVLDHMIDQGFDVGSGMGTNHHYGYQIRKIFDAAWLMRDEIAKRGRAEHVGEILNYWSGLVECRHPVENGRDELLDAWNTLLQSRIIAAMIQPDEAHRLREMKALARWMSSSLRYSPGTLGGIKVDGTSFHHGGHYPAYSVGAFAAVGYYCKVTVGTDFTLDEEARRNFKHALQGLRNYTNTIDWGLGVCGRHPMKGNITDGDINAFGHLASLGDLTGSGKNVDPELAADFLRFKGKDKALNSLFRKEGISAASAPQGFFVMNYAALGIHRRDNWMVSLKAFNTDVWGAEIYTRDNRFGRYQSYGTVQIIGSGSPVSAVASGFTQPGWDWNRPPGATTIHLPFAELENPLPGTLMERNPERFSGVSSLEGRNGIMALKLQETDRKNFTKDARALKSVFCFDNRIICLGSDINNSNANYPTQTTLFQLALTSPQEQIEIDEQFVDAFPLNVIKDNIESLSLSDTKGNFYIVKNAESVVVTKQRQSSPNDKTRQMATGDFATAYINHGTAPKGAQYEYAVYIQPSNKNVMRYLRKDPYEVLRKDDVAHVVRDAVSGITGYVFWQEYTAAKGNIKSASAQTIVMERNDAGVLVMSVCTPDLGITEKAYTTPQASQPIVKEVVVSGAWQLAEPNDAIDVTLQGADTKLTVRCIDGLPVDMRLTATK